MLAIPWLLAMLEGQVTVTVVVESLLVLASPHVVWLCPLFCMIGTVLVSLGSVLGALALPLAVGARRLGAGRDRHG